MAKYKLKEEAKQFFSEGLHDHIGEVFHWQDFYGIPVALLDEIKKLEVRVVIGHDGSFDAKISQINLQKMEAEFYFTVKVSNIGLVKAENIRTDKLQSVLQNVANKFFED